MSDITSRTSQTSEPGIYDSSLVVTPDDKVVLLSGEKLDGVSVECRFNGAREFHDEAWAEDIQNGTTLEGWYSLPGYKVCPLFLVVLSF